MALVIISANDGTVTELDGCYLVDTDKLNEDGQKSWQEWIDGGNNNTAAQVAGHGKDLTRLLESTGYGDLTFGNCMAFTPESLKQEAVERLQYLDTDGPDYPAFLWASTAELDQLRDIGGYIMNSDVLWDEYNESVRLGINWLYAFNVKEQVSE